ncbi:hypothetical protein Dimus_028568 [Dionaea muscipula]
MAAIAKKVLPSVDENLRDKKLKGQLAFKEELYGRSAKVAAKVEKWLMPSEGGYLEVDGIEKSWRIKQEVIAQEVGLLSAKNVYPYIYNMHGTELHCLKEHGAVSRLQLLKNHFPLASINKLWVSSLSDVTMGSMVANHRTKHGPDRCDACEFFQSVVASSAIPGYKNHVEAYKP